MHGRRRANGFSRRALLADSAAVLVGRPGQGSAQSMAGQGSAPSESLAARIAGFVTGFELKSVPPLAIERARTAFVHTVGVARAGSTEKVAEIVRDMVRA